MQSSIDVISVYGMSYSGSTLLNFMLDNIPGIYGGGELHWLRTQHSPSASYAAHCTNCKGECPIWTHENLTQVPDKNFYEFISKLLGVSVIVDTSKTISWFREREERANDSIDFHRFLLVKHPLRHITSFMINQKLLDDTPQRSAIDKAILTFVNYYNEVLSYTKNRAFQIIKYEDLILSNKATLNKILLPVNIQTQETQLNCFDKEHHQIGGNAAAIFMATKKWPTNRSNQPKQRLKQYESQSGVFLDNKYLEYLTPESIEYILQNSAIEQISHALGYSSDKNSEYL